MSEQKFSTLDIAFPLTGKDIVALTQLDSAGVKVSTQTTLSALLTYWSIDLTFDDVNTGLKKTANGQYFKVRNKLTNVMDVYRNDDGVAVRIQDEISGSVEEARQWALKSKESAEEAAKSVVEVKEIAKKVESSANNAAESANNATKAAEESAKSAAESKKSAEASKTSADNAKKSEDSAKGHADSAAESAKNAAESSQTIKDVLNIYKVVAKGEVTNDRLVLNPDEAGMQTLTLTKVSTNVLIDEVKTPKDVYRQVTLYIKQGTGANKIVWDARVSWSNGRIPVLSYRKDAIDIITLVTVDNGNTWMGMYNGGWFNVQ